jgi:hypothetical protein
VRQGRLFLELSDRAATIPVIGIGISIGDQGKSTRPDFSLTGQRRARMPALPSQHRTKRSK